MPPDYIQVSSGLGAAPPLNIVVLPVLFEGEVKAVIELASFYRFSDIHLTFLDQLTESIGIVLNTIAATMRTEELLEQSQSLAAELQTRQQELTETNARLEQQARTLQASEERLKQQQEELQQTNEELEEKAELLARQNAEVEKKNKEIEQARTSLEEKAEQLALTSKYKSEFLANMSHELRTPLNSLLILSQLLAQNGDGNLTGKQVEFARTIHSSGADLLELINEILDLSKIESGTMDVGRQAASCSTDLQAYVDRTFRAGGARRKGWLHGRASRRTLPAAIDTDAKRLQQVLKNLLSNALKFTEQGTVTLAIEPAADGWSRGRLSLDRAASRRRLPRQRHGHRHSRRQAPDHLRGVPAGRRHDQPEVRRHGPGPVDQPRDRGAARRRDPDDERGRGRAARSCSTCRSLSQPAAGRSPATGRIRRAVARAAADRVHRDGATRLIAQGRGQRTIATASTETRSRLLIIENDLTFVSILIDMAREKGFKGSSRCAATSDSRWRASSSRMPSRSTSTCRGSTAGRCSIG